MANYIKLLETMSEYEAFTNSEEFVTPNVSYINEIGGLFFNGKSAEGSPNVVCVYDITDVTQESRIFGEYFLKNLTGMIVDGVEVAADNYYQFDTVGLHTIEYILDDKTKLSDEGIEFGGGNLISISLPATITSLGGAYTFENNNTLKEIICYAQTAPTFSPRYDFTNIRPNGILKYPKGADYTSWLDPEWSGLTDIYNNKYYNLGTYGWTGVEI